MINTINIDQSLNRKLRKKNRSIQAKTDNRNILVLTSSELRVIQ